VGSIDYDIYAIDATGGLKWKFATNGAVRSSPVLGPDGSLYVGSYNKSIYAIDTAGRLKWKFATNGPVFSSPVLGPDGSLYVGSSDYNIYAIDTAGGLKWNFKTNNQVFSSPVLGPDGSLSDDNNIYAIDTGVRCGCPAGTFFNSSVPFTSCPQLEALCIACPKGSYCPYRRTTALPHRLLLQQQRDGRPRSMPCWELQSVIKNNEFQSRNFLRHPHSHFLLELSRCHPTASHKPACPAVWFPVTTSPRRLSNRCAVYNVISS
jgi:hypothetical protein